ncbi:hypothetical protein BU25DRAFT_104643 [Macroventuria anomochaeta]|uniref:Uncharacterized protein n=1 Tax=Macroventuria anomochaeta TaxID=301207 RepID=A0ACB6RVL8_9PLEO|nr:uncharacterized protein BU25DRAFT_104643 [Macroventuria anomochaeta]KAF2625833.1 hypothetical protein BU25DRAFT_104643 [Macroventuria anomochaeta]
MVDQPNGAVGQCIHTAVSTGCVLSRFRIRRRPGGQAALYGSPGGQAWQGQHPWATAGQGRTPAGDGQRSTDSLGSQVVACLGTRAPALGRRAAGLRAVNGGSGGEKMLREQLALPGSFHVESKLSSEWGGRSGPNCFRSRVVRRTHTSHLSRLPPPHLKTRTP